MSDQAVLDLDGRAPDAAHLQHVVAATFVDEVAVFILAIGVAGVQPAVHHRLGRLLGLVPVVPGGRLRLDPQPAALALGNGIAVLIQDAGLVARHRLAAGAGPVVVEPVADEDVQRLGRADAVEDGRAGLFLPAAEHVTGQRLAGRDAGAQGGEVALAHLQRRELGGIEGRHAIVDRRPEGLDVRKGRVGGRPSIVEDGRASDPERERHAIPQPVGKEELGGGVADVVLADPQHAHAVEFAGHDHVALRMDGALGAAGRTGRVEPEAIVFGRGEAGFEGRGGLRHFFKEGLDRHRFRGLRAELLEARRDLDREFRGIDDETTAGILDHVGVVRRAQQCVRGYRYDARLDGPPEQIEEGRAVLHHHEQPVAGRQPAREERVARPVHPLGQFGVAHRFLRRQDRRLCAATFAGMPVDEGDGHVEAGRQPDRMGRGEGDACRKRHWGP